MASSLTAPRANEESTLVSCDTSGGRIAALQTRGDAFATRSFVISK